jgi:hypothetical protein
MTDDERARLLADPTCEYGFPTLCGQMATWVCYPDQYPLPIYACDRHAPLMVSAELAHRLSWAPPLSLPDLKAFVTALAWRAVLLRESNPIRSRNASATFQMARDEFVKRSRTV